MSQSDFLVHLHLDTPGTKQRERERTSTIANINDRPEDYEPDDEDFLYLLQREREFKALCQQHVDISRELRDYGKHTDGELRSMSKERKSIALDLWWEKWGDVVDDGFNVESDGETYITCASYGDFLDNVDKATRPVTRKDKRRLKKDQRKAQGHLRIWMNAGRNPVQSSVDRKTGALLPAVAA